MVAKVVPDLVSDQTTDKGGLGSAEHCSRSSISLMYAGSMDACSSSAADQVTIDGAGFRSITTARLVSFVSRAKHRHGSIFPLGAVAPLCPGHLQPCQSCSSLPAAGSQYACELSQVSWAVHRNWWPPCHATSGGESMNHCTSHARRGVHVHTAN